MTTLSADGRAWVPARADYAPTSRRTRMTSRSRPLRPFLAHTALTTSQLVRRSKLCGAKAARKGSKSGSGSPQPQRSQSVLQHV